MHALHLGVPGWVPRKLTRGGTNVLRLYLGCPWEASPREGRGEKQDSAEVVQWSPGPGQPRPAWQRALELEGTSELRSVRFFCCSLDCP